MWFFYLLPVSHTNPPLLARIRRIYIKGISEYLRIPTVSFSIPVYALPQLSPMQNRWYWVYVEVLSSVKLGSEAFLWASILRCIGAYDMMDGHVVTVLS